MTFLGTVAVAFIVGMGGGEDLTLNETTTAPGETITVSGAGCTPDSGVNLFLDGSILARTRSDATGAFLAPVTIADDVDAGAHTLTAIGEACGASAALTVEKPSSVDGSDSANVIGTVAILLVAVIIAVTIVVTSRRRWADEPAEIQRVSQPSSTGASATGKSASTI